LNEKDFSLARFARAHRGRRGEELEKWNIGMLDKKNKMPKLIIPSFQHSNSFALWPLREKIAFTIFLFLDPRAVWLEAKLSKG